MNIVIHLFVNELQAFGWSVDGFKYKFIFQVSSKRFRVSPTSKLFNLSTKKSPNVHHSPHKFKLPTDYRFSKTHKDDISAACWKCMAQENCIIAEI